MKLNVSIEYVSKKNNSCIIDLIPNKSLSDDKFYDKFYDYEYERVIKPLELNLNRFFNSNVLELEFLEKLLKDVWSKILDYYDKWVTVKYNICKLDYELNYLDEGLEQIFIDIKNFIHTSKPFRNTYHNYINYGRTPKTLNNKDFKMMFYYIYWIINLIDMDYDKIFNDIVNNRNYDIDVLLYWLIYFY